MIIKNKQTKSFVKYMSMCVVLVCAAGDQPQRLQEPGGLWRRRPWCSDMWWHWDRLPGWLHENPDRWSNCLLLLMCYELSHLLLSVLPSWSSGQRRPPREWKILSSNPACSGISSGQVIPVTWKLVLQWLPCQVPGIHYRVRAGTGWSDVSIPLLGEVESLICSYYLSVAMC